jgi:hypothetical protein
MRLIFQWLAAIDGLYFLKLITPPVLESDRIIFSLINLIFLNFLLWIPTLTLPFLRGGNTVEAGSTQFPPLKKGRVRVGIMVKQVKEAKLKYA